MADEIATVTVDDVLAALFSPRTHAQKRPTEFGEAWPFVWSDATLDYARDRFTDFKLECEANPAPPQPQIRDSSLTWTKRVYKRV